MSIRFVIVGGGPGGNTAATVAARLGAEVTLIERDLVGGAAHLWDCVPSKAMIATGGFLSELDRAEVMGVAADGRLDIDALRTRISGIETKLHHSVCQLLESQGVRMIRGTGRLKGPHEVIAETADGVEEIEADAILLATGSRPRIPEWCEVDGERVLTTRQAYPPTEIPGHLIVIGSGVTGVEFTHMFRSLGSDVTLIVSRQQVLPGKDPEVAAALEAEFLRRGVRLYKGARAAGIEVDGPDSKGTVLKVACDDGRVATGTHAVLAIGSIPNSDGLGLDAAGVTADSSGYVPVNHHLQSNVGHIYAAGDLSGKLPLSSVASMQGRKMPRRAMMQIHPGNAASSRKSRRRLQACRKTSWTRSATSSMGKRAAMMPCTARLKRRYNSANASSSPRRAAATKTRLSSVAEDSAVVRTTSSAHDAIP